MRKIIILLVFFSTIIFSQNVDSNSMFSKWYYSVKAGTSFNTIPTLGSEIQISLKSYLITNIFVKLSLGYSTSYDDKSHQIKSYRFMQGPADGALFQTVLYDVEKIKYKIIPFSLGFEYLIQENTLSPFLSIELGYNYSASQREGNIYNGIAGYYPSFDEIPKEYQNLLQNLDDGSSYHANLGIGVMYQVFEAVNLILQYSYQYNDSIINTNKILIGIEI